MLIQIPSYRKFVRVLMPSGTSAFLCGVVAAASFAANQFETIRQQLQIPRGDLGIEHAILSGTNTLLTSIFGVTRANTLVLALFWALVGLVVYMFMHGLMQIMNELGEDVQVRRYMWPKGFNRNRPLEGFIERTIFRAVVVILIIFYLGHFIGYALSDHPEFNIWVNGLVSFIVSWLVWHGIVVLTRLAFLRDRLVD